MNTLISLRGDDGRYYFMRPDLSKHLPWDSTDVRITADGTEIAAPERGWDRYGRGWITVDFDPAEITLHWRSAVQVVGWRLVDLAYASERTPAELSTDDFADLPEQVRESGIYGPVRKPGEDHSATFTADQWVRYDGSPAPDDGHKWVAKLEHHLTHHPGIHHLFPGHLAGFRETAKKHLERRPGIQYVFDKHSYLEIVFALRYTPPKTRWRPKILASGRKSSSRREEVEDRVTKHVNIPITDQIAGVNRAAAVAEWERRLAELDALADEISTVRACSHCDGAGVVTGDVRKAATS